MSADLLAEFDDFSSPLPPPPPPPAPALASSQPARHAPSLQPDPLVLSAGSPGNPGVQQDRVPQEWPSWQDRQGISAWGDLGRLDTARPTPQQTAGDDDGDDDDGWGDFETASGGAPSGPQRVPASPPTTHSSSKPVAPRSAEPQRTRAIRASTVDILTNNLIDVTGSSAPPEKTTRPSWAQASAGAPQAQYAAPKPRPSDPNVLFDADEFEGEAQDEDDFGDFETAAAPLPAPADLLSGDEATPPVPATIATLSLHEPSSPCPRAPESASHHDRNLFPGFGVTAPLEKKPVRAETGGTSSTTAWPSIDHTSSATGDDAGEDWGAFEDFPDKPKAPAPKPTESDLDPVLPKVNIQGHARPGQVTGGAKDVVTGWDWDAVEPSNGEALESHPDQPPPINIPPPSLLLSVFPQLLNQVNTSLLKPIGSQDSSTKNRILTDPKTVDCLRGHLQLATVAAHIIAGRKMRWHRDKFLKQGMSISAAGSKGMKIAGVDKTHAMREEREAADVLGVWKDQLGRLRSAVAAANASITSKREQLEIPELHESLAVQTAKGVPTAPKACLICGLKRDERVSKVDVGVEDSFGEFWTDHWGHTACKRFWLKHETALRQR